MKTNVMEMFGRWSVAMVLTVLLAYLLTPPGVEMVWWKFILLGTIMNILVDLIWQKVKPQ